MSVTVSSVGNTGLNTAALGLRAGGDSRLDGSDNDVATLAADLKGALLFHDLNGVTVGTVGTIKGITAQNRDVTLDLGENPTIASGAGEDTNVGRAKVTSTWGPATSRSLFRDRRLPESEEELE